MSKLDDYLKQHKIDARRVLAASKSLEGLRPEDRAVKLARARAKGADATDAVKEKAKTKPRSGKAVTRPTLDAALRGDVLSGPAKTRILRAVNHLLVQKKQGEASLKDLF